MQDVQIREATVLAGKSLPLEPLLVLLRNNGFLVKPDDYVEMLKVIEKFGTDKIKDAAILLCPLLATTAEEQTKFYKVFEQYIELNNPKKQIVAEKKKFWLIYAIAGLLVFVLGSWMLVSKIIDANRPKLAAALDGVTKTGVGDTAYFDAYAGLQQLNRLGDSAQIKVSWNFGNGWTNEGKLRVGHVFLQPGKHLVQQKIESSYFNVTKPLDSLYINVCHAVPKIFLSVDSNLSLSKGRRLTVVAKIDDPKKVVKSHVWKLKDENNGKEIKNGDVSSFNYRFDSIGDYTLSFTALVGKDDDECNEQQTISIEVSDSSRYQLHISQSAANFSIPSRPGVLLTWGLLLPGLLGLGGSLWFRNYLKRQKEKKSDIKKDFAHGTAPNQKPPFEIPFENNDIRLVWLEQKDREILRSLRQKMDDEMMLLNIPQTIKNTIRSGGFPGAIFTPQLKPLEYLVLIDRSNPRSMLTALFDYMVRSWDEENIAAERFFYNKGFEKFYNSQYPTGISLRRLVELYKNSTLVIMGDAHDLVYSAYPVINKDLLDEFNEWEQKAVLTPVSFADWGEKEKEIARYYLLLPADIEGQLTMVSAIKEKMLNQKPYLNSQPDHFYEVEWFDLQSVSEIKNYLEQDELLFQWLCSIAVSSKIRWEFFVETGKALMEKYGQPEKLNFTNLLKLCRISWMKEGVFPEKTRLELLKELKVENEVLARETLLRLYKFADDFYKGENFFQEEKELQQVSNEFVLYAHDKEKYASFQQHAELFGELWTNNKIPDNTFRQYIGNKSGNKWETPIDDNHIKDAGSFIAKENEAARKQKRSKTAIANAAAILSSLLLILFGIIQLSWNSFEKRIPTSWKSALTRVDSTKNVTFAFAFDSNIYCGGKQVGKINPALSAEININNGRLMTFNSDTSFQFPYNYLNKPVEAVIIYDKNKPAAVRSFALQGNVHFSLTNCPDSTKGNDSIGTPTPDSCSLIVSSILPAYLNTTWQGNANRRLLTIDTKKRVLNYSTGSTSTFGTYTIAQVCLINRMYKVILAGNGQFRVIFLRNLSRSGFALSVCPGFYSTKELADSVRVACGSFDKMTIYKKPEEQKKDSEQKAAKDNNYNNPAQTTVPSDAQTAKQMFDKGEYKGALALYDKLLQGSYPDPEFYYYRGVCKFNLKDKRGACDDLQRGIKEGCKLCGAAVRQYCETSKAKY